MFRDSTARAARSTPSKAPDSLEEIQIPSNSSPAFAIDSNNDSSFA